MKPYFIPVVGAVLALVACNESTSPTTPGNSTGNQSSTSGSDGAGRNMSPYTSPGNNGANRDGQPASAGKIQTGPVEGAVLPQRDASSISQSGSKPADNSVRNLREDGSQVTPLDQGENELDRGITQGIRSSLVGRDDLSTNAKNIKIITRDGVVVLRGPVSDARERDTIAATASAQSGVKRLDNQLEPIQP